MAVQSSAFIDVLKAGGPAPDRADKMGLYGWLIGDWTFDAAVTRDDGTQHNGSGEIHFGWVLGGRAIQDVWILPGFFHGTTLRVYDPGIDGWHILWNDPLKQLSTPARSAAPMVATSYNSARPRRARCCAGPSPTSRGIRFAGGASARPTTAQRGGCNPNSRFADAFDLQFAARRFCLTKGEAVLDHI